MGIQFAAFAFIFDGLCAVLCAGVFFLTRNQDVYMAAIVLVVTFFLISFALFCPESPKFLFEKKRFEQLSQCLAIIARTNGRGEAEISDIKLLVQKMASNSSAAKPIDSYKETAPNGFSVLVKDRGIRNNLIASTLLASAMGFSFYLITFYIKYFKGNVFLNFAALGLADSIAFFFITKLSKNRDIPSVMRILLVGAGLASLVFFLTQAMAPTLIPIALILLRLNVGGLFNYSYHYNSKLFPILVKGAVFAITNSVARPSQAAATMVAEYVEEPGFLILTSAVICFAATFLVSEQAKLSN